MNQSDIWIVGAGAMAREYSRVLDALGRQYTVIGRSREGAVRFETETGHSALAGGIEAAEGLPVPSHAIVAVNVEQLAEVTARLARLGVKRILVEKPAFCSPDELDLLAGTESEIFVAYNRRFFASVLAAEKIVAADGGLLSFHFEFTEWSRSVCAIERPEKVFHNWFYANSTHVVDLAFFLGGLPTDLSVYTAGKLDWHTPAIFTGAGRTERGALFSYCANWQAPGRWAVELLTGAHRLYLKPMEQLQIQQLNSVKVEPVEIDDRLDREFKPGLYLQTRAFLEGDTSRLCSLAEHMQTVRSVYTEICRRQ